MIHNDILHAFGNNSLLYYSKYSANLLSKYDV